MNISLDRKTIFLLASETRLEILKKLDERRMTLTELAKSLDLSKTAVKEHLDKLVNAGLVRRVDEGRKWIYYELTSNGKTLMHPEEARIKLIISLIVAISFSAIGILQLFESMRVVGRFMVKEATKSVPSIPISTPTPTLIPTPTHTPAPIETPISIPQPSILSLSKGYVDIIFDFYIGLALLLLGFSIALYAIRRFG